MKQYFATSLHDDEWTARQFMPAGSVPVPVYLVTDLKPDSRNGRCACVWNGDCLATVCFAHLQAVSELDAAAREALKDAAHRVRWLLQYADPQQFGDTEPIEAELAKWAVMIAATATK